jgi:hypothetical protein
MDRRYDTFILARLQLRHPVRDLVWPLLPRLTSPFSRIRIDMSLCGCETYSSVVLAGVVLTLIDPRVSEEASEGVYEM